MLAVCGLFIDGCATNAGSKGPVPLETLEGQPRTLSAFSGKPLVVNLWATWCPECREELPMLARRAKIQNSATFVFIDQGEDAVRVKKYLSDLGLTLDHVLIDPGSRLADIHDIPGYPATLFFDQAGKLKIVQTGPISQGTLDVGLALLDDGFSNETPVSLSRRRSSRMQ